MLFDSRMPEDPTVKLEFEKGDNVTINEGPFESYEGTVDEVLPGKDSFEFWSPSSAVRLRSSWSTGRSPRPTNSDPNGYEFHRSPGWPGWSLVVFSSRSRPRVPFHTWRSTSSPFSSLRMITPG